MRRFVTLSLASLVMGGCARAPSPLAPHWAGSIGVPHRGVLTRAVELPASGPGFRVLRENDRHFGTKRFVSALTKAAGKVHEQRPGGTLVIGDLSAKTGGKIPSHASHRTGRDVDLLFYTTTLEGAPATPKDFVHLGTDGLAWDKPGQRFLRFDVEREWLLVKALVESPDARVQWLFASRPVLAMLLEWGRARGEPGETLVRAMEMLVEPGPPAQSHDDHLHVRIACDAEEVLLGCEPSGPARPWIANANALSSAVDAGEPTTVELVEALLLPLPPTGHALPAGDSKWP